MDNAIIAGSKPHLLTSKKSFTDPLNCGKLIKCYEIENFFDILF